MEARAEDLDIDALLGVVDLVDAVVFRVDVETSAVRLVGHRVAERLGWPVGKSIEGSSFWAAVPEGSRSEVLALLRDVARDGVARSLEHPMRTAGAGDRWFRTAMRPANEGGRPSLIGVILDVTDAHHVAAQWMELESWIVALGDTMPLDFWICDRDGRCVLQNPVSRARRGNLTGTKDPWGHCVAEALSGRRTHEELEIEGDGRSLYLVRIVSPIERDGRIQGVLGIEVDVTERKEAEQRLKGSLDELRAAQDSLVRKKQLAAMGEMSALVAHEIRNPLGAIANAVAVLSKSVGPGGAEVELCRIIDEEVKRLDRLVASLLDSVRPMRAELAPVMVSVVVDDALSHSLRSEGRASEVCVHRTFDPTLSEVPVDAELFAMALRNVFRNALQAMQANGEIFIDVRREVKGDHEWMRVTVRDSGPGLPQVVRDRIFEPFVTTRAAGSGLGLTIVRRVLEAHRGTVSFSSEPGYGATCVLRLPICEATG